jgi:hypothetical protein
MTVIRGMAASAYSFGAHARRTTLPVTRFLLFLIGFLLFMFTLFSKCEAATETLGELMQECEELESFWKFYPPVAGKTGARIPNQAGAAICYGYMLAFDGLRNLALGPAHGVDISMCYQTSEGKLAVDLIAALYWASVPRQASYLAKY